MSEIINERRRSLLCATALSAVAAPLGTALPALAQNNGSGPATNSAASFGPLRKVNAGVLSIAYVEAGPANGPPMILWHGWPYDIHSFIDVAPILASAGYRVLIPYLRGFGETRFLSADTPRNAEPAAFATDARAFLDALGIQQALFAGFDWGTRIASLLGILWPERCKGLVLVSGYGAGSRLAVANPLPPDLEHKWWYQFYFATERGQAGYAKYTKEFNRLIWRLASPRWAFDDATFDRAATAFENPDFVQITLGNYRWFLGLAQGESHYDEIEAKMERLPTISLPTITLEGDANGAPHAEPAAYAKKFTGKYQHRTITGGIGHNLPQEAPEAFARAIIDVDKA